MSCAACSASVTRVVSRLEGVEACEVNLITGKMTVTFDETETGEADFIRVVEKAGFGIEPDIPAETPKTEEKAEKKIRELDQLFALDTVLQRKAGKLSGGWQRRVSIAMALVSEPEILFLDEPTLGLDVIARHDLWELIRSLKGKITIILTTHYMEEAAALSDRIGIMKDGRLLAVGMVSELNELAGTDDFETAFVKIVREGIV